MRALVLRDFGHLEVADLPEPGPCPGEVLVRIAYTGICGSDIHGFTGKNGRRVPGQVMGHETSGVVLGLGEGVTDLPPGTPVTVNPVVVPEADAAAWRGREQQHPGKYVIGVAPERVAAFAELLVVPARNVVALGEVSLPHGALIEPLAVAAHAISRVPPPDGPVLVAGGGPIGQSVALALRQAGVGRVLVTEPASARRDLLARLGAEPIDPSGADVAAEVVRRCGGPVAAAFDAVGSGGTLADCLRATRDGGMVCLVGMGTPELALPALEVSTHERAVVGSFAYSSVDFELAAARLAASSPEQTESLISRVVPLTEAPAAFTALAAGDGTAGKVLVDLS